MDTWEIFSKKYAEAPSEVRDFLDSEKIAVLAEELCQKNELLKKPLMIIAISDFILGIIDKIELGKITQLAEIELGSFIEKIKGSYEKPSKVVLEYKDRLELRPEGSERAEPTREETVRPLTHDELMSALSARRTMASDIEAVRQKRDEDKKGFV